LTPSARSGNLIAGDGTRNGLSAPNKEPAANQKNHLTEKLPYKSANAQAYKFPPGEEVTLDEVERSGFDLKGHGRLGQADRRPW
jgi:hypothetical protein